jgi:hypothetical protein
LRGESGRIWSFLSPFVLLTAAQAVSLESPARRGVPLTLVQAIMVVVMVGFLRVVGSGLSAPPARPPALAESPATSVITNGAEFAETVQLLSFAGYIELLPASDGRGEARPTLILWLNWRSAGQLEKPYYLSLIPVSPKGQPGEATLAQPFNGQYPATCWLPDSGLIQTQVEAPLFGEQTDGQWWVSLSLIDREGNTLPVLLPDGSRDQQVGLGPFSRLSP